MLARLKNFGHECVRVFKVTKKPTREEFKVIVKVSMIGILVVGMIGFLIQMGWQLLT